MNGLLFKEGVSFSRPPRPAGMRILGALERTARRLQVTLTITCTDGSHPPDDPHTLGEAYDVRTHDLTQAQKLAVLRETMLDLEDDDNQMDHPLQVAGGLATLRFFGQIEKPNQPDEHLHFQRRRGTVYHIEEGKKA